jgi:hypothetical protein
MEATDDLLIGLLVSFVAALPFFSLAMRERRNQKRTPWSKTLWDERYRRSPSERDALLAEGYRKGVEAEARRRAEMGYRGE